MFNTAWALGRRCQAKHQQYEGLGRSVSFRCSKGAGSGVTTQLVVFSHIQEHSVSRLQRHQRVWKQKSCGSLWNMWKYHPKPYDPSHRWGSAALQLCCHCCMDHWWPCLLHSNSPVWKARADNLHAYNLLQNLRQKETTGQDLLQHIPARSKVTESVNTYLF